MSAASCQLCSSGDVVAVVPAGPCAGLKVCERCSLALQEAAPLPPAAESPSRPHLVIELRMAPPSFEGAVLATGYGRAIRALVEELSSELDHGEIRQLSVLPDRCAIVLWHALARATMADLLAGLRATAREAGVDLRVAPEVRQAERLAEQEAAAEEAIEEATEFVTRDTVPCVAAGGAR